MSNTDQSESSTLPDSSSREELLYLAQQINALTNAQANKIEDIGLAQESAMAVKPLIDRLVSLNYLVDPIGRIIDKSRQMEDLRDDLEGDIETVENLSVGLKDASPQLASEIGTGIAQVKRDRKLFVSQSETADRRKEKGAHSKSKGLLSLPVEERFACIFSDRFLSLKQIESIFSISFSPSEQTRYAKSLEQLWSLLFERSEFRPHVEKNRVEALAKAFNDYVVIFRSPKINNGETTSVSTLRDRFPAFFVQANVKSLWYSKLDFYNQPLGATQWALIDKQYLNCTFKKPSYRLLMYARANGLPGKSVRQKTLVEDLYDRIATEIALTQRFFDNCNSITQTVYQESPKSPLKQVYLYYKEQTIRISGKSGTPHWKPTRPRWPGLLPSIVVAR